MPRPEPSHFQSGSVTKLPSGTKTLYTSANPFEQTFGYHRAVKRDAFIFVSGTTALKEVSGSMPQQPEPESDDGRTLSKVHHPASAKLQAQIAMERCVDAVLKLGGKREDVVRVKMFVSRHEDCGDVGAAFRECFGGGSSVGVGWEERMEEVGATATMIVVQNGFVDPDILVEVEVDAVVS